MALADVVPPALLALIGCNVILTLSLYLPIASGQLTMGVGAFASVGAYAAGVLTAGFGAPLGLALVAAVLAAGALGGLIGLPCQRMRGIYLATATIGLGELVRVTFEATEYVGGVSGLRGLRGTTLPLALGLAGACVVLTVLLDRSRFGLALRAIARDEQAAGTLGIDVPRTKLIAFVIGSGMSGLGGALLAHYLFFIEPSMFDFRMVVLIFIYLVFGGIETPWGALLGGALLTAFPEYIRPLADWRMVVYGVLVVGMMAARPEGLLPRRDVLRLGRWVGDRLGRGRPPAPASARRPVPRAGGSPGVPVLSVESVTKRFAGLTAVDGVSFEVREGEILGLIGPNGAGKTTVFNLVSGLVPPTEGAIRVRGRSITALRPWAIARLGVSRTFQILKLFGSMTALENVMVALPGRARDEGAPLLDLVGLHGRHDVRADQLPLGEQRAVELARALALRPSLLLLDEPAAGLNEVETRALGRVIRDIRTAGCAVVLIEHDVALVMDVCDRVVVLSSGRTLAEGTPAEVQREPAVVEAYLGREE